MEQPEKTQFNAQLRERTVNVAIRVRKAIKAIEIESVDRHIVNQLLRSSTSVAANYSAATRGRSDAEYFSKICIVVEECDETLFWIKYLIQIGVLDKQNSADLPDEVEQLVKLFSSIRKKMKEKTKRNQV
jgi:four helix bundle protein